MAALCVICQDDASPCDLRLPGCSHAFHAACILTFAQYDARCPVCRRVPVGVRERKPDEEVPTVYLSLEPDLNHRTRDQRLLWSRYRNRRRRLLNRNLELLVDFNRLRDLRFLIEEERRRAESRYKILCRETWRTDTAIREHMRTVGRLRRRERRLEQSLHEAFRGRLGSEPS